MSKKQRCKTKKASSSKGTKTSKSASKQKKGKIKKHQTQRAWSILLFELRYLTICVSIIGLVSIILFASGQYSTYASSYNTLDSQMKFYSEYGWDIDAVKKDFDSDYTNSVSANFLIDLIRPTYLKDYTDKLHYIVDTEKEEILSQKAYYKDEAMNLYLPEISPNTNSLDYLFDEVTFALESENKVHADWALEEIESEIDLLNARQDILIAETLDRKIHTAESIHFMGLYYGIDQSNKMNQASEIAQSEDEPLQKFLKIDEVNDEMAQKLDEKIVERGGRITDGKRILIIVSLQRLYMIEDYDFIYEMPASTGIHGHATGLGEFQVYEKVDMVWGYYHIWMPYWLTVYYSGGLENGIHGIPISPVSGRWSHWESVVGVSPITYGCIMPKDEDAKIVYEWADVGIPVSIVY